MTPGIKYTIACAYIRAARDNNGSNAKYKTEARSEQPNRYIFGTRESEQIFFGSLIVFFILILLFCFFKAIKD